MSVRLSACNISAPTGRIFMKFYIWVLVENISWKFKFLWNLTRMTFTVHKGQNTFLIISRSVLLRMRNVSDKSCRENQNTCFVSGNFFLGNRAVCEIMWGKILQSGADNRWQCGACALHAGYLRLHTHTHTQTHTRNM